MFSHRQCSILHRMLDTNKRKIGLYARAYRFWRSKMALCLSRWWNCAKDKARKFSGQLLHFFSSRKRQQGDERTGSNAGLNQDAGVSDTGEPHEPNSARGNRDRKLREAVQKSFILANTAGGLANEAGKLVAKLEKKHGNMNPFTTLKEAIYPEENRASPIIGKERTGRNASLIQHDGMPINPAPGAAGRNSKPLKSNSARGNRDRKLREAVQKSLISANTARGFANEAGKLVTKLEKKDGNMNPFTTLKEAIDPKENRASPIIGKERTGRNASLIQHGRMPIKPASGAAGRNGKPLKPNSARGNRDKKLRKAVQTSASLTSTTGQFADTCKQ